MAHQKMLYTYVGVDSHKDRHTAVLIDCFFEKLGEIGFGNLPSGFPAFLAEAQRLKTGGTELIFGLEDTGMYGRALTVFLAQNGQKAKHVNALLVARERKNQNIVQKTDSIDAECAARILLSRLAELPDAEASDKYWALRTLVTRRAFVVKSNVSLKNHLHSILMHHYPGYQGFFPCIDSKASLAFFMRYPSPKTLDGVDAEGLAEYLRGHTGGKVGGEKALAILNALQNTEAPFQEVRDEAVRSTIRQIQANIREIEQLEKTMGRFLDEFDCTLTSMSGIDVVCAAQMLSCIGDIKKFSTPAKLARYAGIAPVTYASGKKNLRFSNQRGNRELNSVFFLLALRLITTCHLAHKIKNPFIYEYYHRKISEGKTKRQALKCVQRRLVNIVWTMLTNNEEYINPPKIDAPGKKEGGAEK